MIVESQRDNLKQEFEKYRAETNSIFYDLSKQLLTLAVITITVSPVFLENIAGRKSTVMIYLWAMGAALISIFCGIAQLYRDHSQFQEYMQYMSIITYKNKSRWSEQDKKLIEKFSEKYKKGPTFNTGHWWLVVQLFAVLLSLSIFLLVVGLAFL